MSETKTTEVPEALIKVQVRIKRIGELEDLIKSVTTLQQSRVAALVRATEEGLREPMAELDALKKQVEELAKAHRLELFGPKAKTLDVATHVMSFRCTEAIEADDNEADVIELLRAVAEDEAADAKDRLAAAACLTYPEPKLDKSFIRKHWKRHQEWFAGYFGLRKTPKEKFNLKAKATPENLEDNA